METPTKLFDDITKLARQYVPGPTDYSLFLQARRKDLDALLAVGRITGDAVQSVAGKQVDTLRALGEDLRSALTGQSDSERSKSEALRDAAQKAIAGVAELAQVVVNAQSDAFDTVKLRAYAGVEELKSLLGRAP